MPDKNVFDRYLLALRNTKIEEKTEHTDRAALQTLLQAFADESANGAAVQHEPKRVADKGAPDFKITSRGLILGYVENKAIGEHLDKVLKSNQIARYKTLSQNIILTDYLHFIWISKDGIKRASLCHVTDFENPKFRLSGDHVAAVAALLQAVFSTPPDGIGRAQQLALALATRSKLLHDYLGEELVRQEREHKEGRLYGLFQIFRDQVFHELTLNEFADAFAQMLAYGLFLARLNSGSEPVTLHNAREHVPGSFRLIRELVDFLVELDKHEYRDVRWVVEEVLSIVNALNLPAIEEDLSFRRRKAISRKVRAGDEEEHRLFERDPFIYFYEDYLKAYDAATRKARGVYYTPPPIVNFIVRAVDDILKESFGISDGLADHQRVTVLDFACGTGTFLLEVFQRILDNVGGPGSGRADPIVREHLLTNIFGFEYLIAPYTIAHLKLSQYLRDQGHPLKSDERLQVFLTNTLEPIHPEPHFLLPAITAETEAAQAVKDQPIVAIVGNPPYAYESRNNGSFITTAIDDYRYTLERPAGTPTKDRPAMLEKRPLGERNPRGLQDDYVKFIRFAQMKMDAVSEGVVGVITNHSWLDNATFRGMRQSLLRSFEQIYVLDLHGNAKKKERAPDGSKDENVFDIEQGVAISVFVKHPGLERGVWRGDLWGKRLKKYEVAAAASLKNLGMERVQISGPDYMFFVQNLALKEVYDLGWNLPSIFTTNSVGIVTARDDFTLAHTAEEMWRRVQYVVNSDAEDVRKVYKLGKDSRDWTVAGAITDLNSEPLKKERLKSVHYRPFDIRHTYLTGRSRGFLSYPREAIWSRLGKGNLALVSSRFTKGESFAHALVTDSMIEKIIMSPNTSNNGFIFPLYGSPERNSENLSADFRTFLDTRYEYHYTAEEILGYIYAVLNAPTYRARYMEFLRTDFPRVLFPDSANDFETLSDLGWALVQAHLLRELPRRKLAAYHGKGDHSVDAVRYSPEEQTISINKTQFFKPVPQAVWEFHIGGYQVLDKYLKSRKGRALALDEINHLAAIADSLAFTIDQMAKIDIAYTAAFPDRG
jgi:predicted helicase